MNTEQYIATVQHALDCGRKLTSAIAVHKAKCGHGWISTEEGAVAAALHDLKQAQRDLMQADADLEKQEK